MIRWEVRKARGYTKYPWRSIEVRGGTRYIVSCYSWDQAMEYANRQIAMVREAAEHVEIVKQNGWPQLCGLL